MPTMAAPHIGDRIRQLRRERLLTQEELSEKSGVGVASIIRIERGQVESITVLSIAAGTENRVKANKLLNYFERQEC